MAIHLYLKYWGIQINWLAGMTWPRSIAIKDDIMVAVSKNDNVIGVINIDQEHWTFLVNLK